MNYLGYFSQAYQTDRKRSHVRLESNNKFKSLGIRVLHHNSDLWMESLKGQVKMLILDNAELLRLAFRGYIVNQHAKVLNMVYDRGAGVLEESPVQKYD